MKNESRKIKMERLSREAVRAIEPGKTTGFRLPTRKACDSARVTALKLKTLEDIELTTSIDYANRIIYITRKEG